PAAGSGMRDPSSPPVGTLWRSLRVLGTWPWPRQVVQGSAIVSPAPPERGQVRATWKKPLAWRTRPAPPQVLQMVGLVPALAPEPSQTSQLIKVGMAISTSAP